MASPPETQGQAGWLDAAERWRLAPTGADDPSALAALWGLSGAGELERELRRHFHSCSEQLVERWRLEAAARALLDTETGPAQIAADLGFATEPAFDAAFRGRFLLGPEDYRDLLGRRCWTFELPAWWRQQSVVEYWARDPSSRHESASAERIRWAVNDPRGPLGMDLMLPKADRGERTARAELIAEADDDDRLAAWAHETILRLLGLHLDPADFERRTLESEHRRLVEGRRGLVIPQTASVFDGIAWVVCGQQVSLPVAFKLRRGLADRFGRPVGDLLTTPTAADVAEAADGELFALGFSRRKEEYLRGIARDIEGADPELVSIEGWRHRSALEIEERLLAVRGFGPWSVNYLRMRSFGLADCVPLGDAALARALQNFFALEGRPKADETAELMSPFAPHRSLASFHFWASLKDGSG